MRVLEQRDAQGAAVVIHWPDRARRRLLPSRAHDLALPPEARPEERPARPPVLSARLAASALDALSPRRARVPEPARALVAQLRFALLAADDASYAAARAAVGQPRHALAAGLLAAAFTDDAELTRRAAEAWLARPLPEALIEDFGPFVTDPALTARLVEATLRAPYGLRERALDLLAHLGAAAQAPLTRMLFERWSDSSVKPVAQALALVASEEAGRALLPLLASRPLRSVAMGWARRHPALALPALTRLRDAPDDFALDMAQAHDLEPAVEPALRALAPKPAPGQRRAPGWPRDAPASLRAGAEATPSFVVVERLPALRTRSGASLPPAAGARWIDALTSRTDASDVVEGCDPASLADFAWAGFEAWREGSGQLREGWPFDALARAIDDARVGALAELALEMQRAGRAVHAARAVETLATRATPLAILHLERLARLAPYPKLRAAAGAALDAAAERAGLSPHALVARLLPRLGLDARAERRLRIGAREIVVCCDDALRLRVRGPDGALRARFPARRVADPPADYDAAKDAFLAMRRDLGLVHEALLAWLERAMVTQRAQPWEELRASLATHPIARPLLERLVLSVDGALRRLAEDGTLADVDDRERDADDEAPVTVAHPARIEPAARARWAEVLADYGLTQPLRQLGRPVLRPSDAERAAGRARRLEGRELPWRAVSALRERGFDAGPPEQGRLRRFTRRVPAVAEVALEVSPGLHPGSPVGSGPQRVTRASIDGLAELDDIRASEALLAFESLDGASTNG